MKGVWRGNAVMGFINGIRLNEVKTNLDFQPGIAISVLAGHMEFNSPKYFSHLFKKKSVCCPANVLRITWKKLQFIEPASSLSLVVRANIEKRPEF